MNDEWETPPELMADLEREFGPFDLDPCATALNAKAPRWFGRELDGLSQAWRGRVFMNPPYGVALNRWVAKAEREAAAGRATVVCLVPASTDSSWWHDHVVPAATLTRFLRGRLRFVKDGHPAGRPRFASAIVVFGELRRRADE